MEAIFELLLGAIGEILLQVIGEALFELGFYSLAEALQRKKKRNPFLAALGYFLWGGIVGAISLFVFPSSFIRHKIFRIANLLVAPFFVGFVMAGIGSWRRKKGQDLIRLDSFSYGALFAVSMAIVRFIWTS